MLRALRRRARYVVHNALFRANLTSVSIVEIDPQSIGYVQFPELWTFVSGHSRPLAARSLPGDWDLVDYGARPLWSGRYEARGTPSRMIPLESFGFYQACVARFTGGADWRATAWYRWLGERIAAGERIRRYETLEAVESQLGLLDRMYEDILRDGYQSMLLRQAADKSRLPRWMRRPPEWDEPVVNLGRGGRIAIEDGRHRLCIARVAGAPRVRVRVSAFHPDAGI